MKKKYLCMVLIVLSLFLCGCGTAIYELTAEEEELIIQSAAYFVAKHNIQQKDGVSNIIIEEETESESDAEVETESVPENTETGNTDTENSGNSDSSAGEGVVEQGITLAEAIGHASDLKVTYEGSYLAANYVEGAAYSVDAPAGYTYYVMKIKITNTTAGNVTVNNAATGLMFRLVSGDMKVKSEVTFLNADFSTFLGTIPAGQSVDTILLFEVQESKAENISAPALQIMIGNEIKNVKL